MIVSFTLDNWTSFKDKVTFSMVASRERQHGNRLARLRNYQAKILPIAAIYGGNASGKTNFFKALGFAKKLVVFGTRPGKEIPVEPFLLDTKAAEKPSHLEFVLVSKDSMYEYGFSVTRKAVLEEKLVKIGNKEKTLYHRRNGGIEFHKSLAEEKFLQYAFQGTRPNQLFLTNSVEQNIETFRPVYDWFDDTLTMIAPDARFGSFELFVDEGRLHSAMNKILPLLDAGIASIGGEDIPFENIPIPEFKKNEIQENTEEGEGIRLLDMPGSERFLITREDGKMLARKLITYHAGGDGLNVKFNMSQESDGSKRVIDLLPAFLELASQDSKRVYVIDELDRSLHTILSRRLIESYLARCADKSRTQLLLTTHDVLLMDQQIMRRDEMWVTERDNMGASSLTSFSDYLDIRYDKDIRKSYLQGRLGGIPRIMSTNLLEGPNLFGDGEGF